MSISGMLFPYLVCYSHHGQSVQPLVALKKKFNLISLKKNLTPPCIHLYPLALCIHVVHAYLYVPCYIHSRGACLPLCSRHHVHTLLCASIPFSVTYFYIVHAKFMHIVTPSAACIYMHTHTPAHAITLSFTYLYVLSYVPRYSYTFPSLPSHHLVSICIYIYPIIHVPSSSPSNIP
jgi:hypothetical protein